MPWQPRDLMDTKREFVQLALQEGANRRELCRRFGIGAKAAYALLARYAQEGDGAFKPRSRRPHVSPLRTPAAMEETLLELRRDHPAWGGRKLARRLAEQGHRDVPSAATVTAILHRHGLITPVASAAAQHWQRFEHPEPNALWQIDFKGYFETAAGKCHPLTVLDDHSRFNLALQACARPDTPSVRAHLTAVFERYGLPLRINADNGGPWGTPSQAGHGLSELSVWLIRQGIQVSHSAPYHPQTNGKIERFHRSLKAEVLAGRSFADLAQAQSAFEFWRGIYNCERPHQALGLCTPVERYRSSPRTYVEQLATIEYSPDDTVRVVGWNGAVAFQGVKLRVSTALHRLPIAFRADPQADGFYDAFFCHHHFMRLNMKTLIDSN